MLSRTDSVVLRKQQIGGKFYGAAKWIFTQLFLNDASLMQTKSKQR